MTVARWAIISCCLFVTAASPEPRLTILSSPGVVGNGHATIQVHVPRHPENEALVVALLDGHDLLSRSQTPLYLRPQTVFTYDWWGIQPADGVYCDCTLLAVLYDTRAEVARESRPMVVTD